MTHNRLNRILRFAVMILGVVTLAGCGGGDGRRAVFPVTGRVTVDGKVAKDAYLVFYPTKSDDPMAPKPTAVADEQGNLVVTTYATGDGAPAGEYKVGIEWPLMTMQMGRMQRGKDQLGGKFRAGETSPWTIQIKDGPTTLPDFDVKTK